MKDSWTWTTMQVLTTKVGGGLGGGGKGENQGNCNNINNKIYFLNIIVKTKDNLSVKKVSKLKKSKNERAENSNKYEI